MIGTYELNENQRVRVEYDEDSESPLTWGEHISKDGPEYAAWAQGEVYGIILEHRVSIGRAVYDHATGETDEDYTQASWQEVDSLWGVYLTDEYTPEIAARDHFYVND